MRLFGLFSPRQFLDSGLTGKKQPIAQIKRPPCPIWVIWPPLGNQCFTHLKNVVKFYYAFRETFRIEKFVKLHTIYVADNRRHPAVDRRVGVTNEARICVDSRRSHQSGCTGDRCRRCHGRYRSARSHCSRRQQTVASPRRMLHCILFSIVSWLAVCVQDGTISTPLPNYQIVVLKLAGEIWFRRQN